MRLVNRLQIAGTEYKLIRHDVSLRLSEVGSANFEVHATSAPKGLVLFDKGYQSHELHRVFIGHVEKSTPKSSKHWTVQCRELSDALTLPAHLSLRSCYLVDVLSDVSKETLPIHTATDAAYSQLKVSRMTSTGDGRYALRSIDRVFKIDDFVWWQTVAGDVWCGAWGDSSYAKQGDLTINPKLYTKQLPHSATLPALPLLRPGMLVNGKRISFVRHKGASTTIRWKK